MFNTLLIEESDSKKEILLYSFMENKVCKVYCHKVSCGRPVL